MSLSPGFCAPAEFAFALKDKHLRAHALITRAHILYGSHSSFALRRSPLKMRATVLRKERERRLLFLQMAACVCVHQCAKTCVCVEQCRRRQIHIEFYFNTPIKSLIYVMCILYPPWTTVFPGLCNWVGSARSLGILCLCRTNNNNSLNSKITFCCSNVYYKPNALDRWMKSDAISPEMNASDKNKAKIKPKPRLLGSPRVLFA